MKASPLSVSIIIPTVRYNSFLEETLQALSRISTIDFEIIVLPDHAFAHPKVRVAPTGKVSPGEKRDIGATLARGDVLAFIDDDAYPTESWLPKAIAVFERDPSIVAVGGPAITPKNDPFWARVSGAFFASPLGGGHVDRYFPGEEGYREDWPTVNLLVRAEAFRRAGGFDTRFWPGEDTKLCRDLLVKTGSRIWYEPEAVVYHHRRSGFFRHLQQVGRYGLHRGFFTKAYPETSLKPAYFVPSGFLLAIMAAGLTSPISTGPLYSLLTVYGAACGFNILALLRQGESPAVALATPIYSFFSHLAYGWTFLQGAVLTRHLESRLAEGSK